MKITFLGGGNMASALIGGLVQQGFAAADIQVVELQEAGRERLRQQFGVQALATLDDSALACEVLVLAVKPQQMHEALTPLQGRLATQLVLSIAAGLRVADLSRWLGGYARVVRAMPNTPALIGQGVTGLYAAPAVSETERAAVARVLGAVGSSVWVEAETQLDAVTALSGSGPAYVFHFIEALEAGGTALGLAPQVARQLAIETLVGASALAAHSTESPGVLRERVTSKGGTTAAALQVLGEGDMQGLVARALQAAARRSAELGDELSKD
ncbi:MAG: pyrroline-5-carboxylate reductase [Candidatus Dactylopiibacterium carminicum]|uniref:Pyrroline-5-carboxylate reductase n=1 Tax=Candidatus Dactylopiibacterium carminicum TaxID=857335 RepID=A0A272ERG8_9RHOO|nr:pyrroline-5-carboxylate reductase [Candidatus Dactylopiibacterium carminicum]KAF7598791.1 pyrroline-5-carboxylate reductase [Candidatus Dactylopiibacterium carminicum]PAS92682.1 MAG: pyrroline-5-carboxylate reductase [Candidatus Dactylopiibacterium carminicum]PAS94725.1 MAG: pyrroline-5-carboxylate reductase [Candidatus Dactylopiibacterium carminicum]PAS98812.1 MAG: pyrroline-5-carboxylate reductase [Candidatus Dactylopiibacterium carminicum]